ncbi:hypothetical protein N7466_000740 [Penicillium verhagenii]|uniref:uncharacterized protein n=1 Tax=Penicillium verhagenii TaxID=1562060 RepID=UPI0025456160|nr:uncharacterized protein N7466_000740 [Penicillium verhagenii]KAJ5947725.1 hypothetical protein N7466_000740 [Penicillium verhagenii]
MEQNEIGNIDPSERPFVQNLESSLFHITVNDDHRNLTKIAPNPKQSYQVRNSAPSLSASTVDDMTRSLAWLHAPELPNGENLRILVEEYFAHVHPLRCNGFVHKPSFMQRLDEDVDSCRRSESLLHIICALGAKFFALNYTSQLSPDAILTAGNQWAKIAKARIFVDMDDLSIEKLMVSLMNSVFFQHYRLTFGECLEFKTAILLYDHDLRVGSYASAFMLSGMTARMSQALQLNLEKSADVLSQHSVSSAITNETRRRLMWSCYLLDSWVGSGVNQLTLLEDRDLKIQLPCHSQNFSLGIICLTETLDEGEILSFVPREQVPLSPCQNMGIEAYFIRLVSIRKKVLRYVKHLDTAKPPWQEDSEFQFLSAEFEKSRRSLPKSLYWNSGAIYARKESSQLGALTLLWCTFHQTLVDLYRIGMPTLFRIQKEVNFPSDQQEFLQHCRKVCFDNACEVSRIISKALQYGLKVLADSWICIIAHDSTKVMLHYLKLNRLSHQREIDDTVTLVQSNLDALLQMRSMVATAEHCSVSVVKMMAAAGIRPNAAFNTPASDPLLHTGNVSPPTSAAQESPESILNPLAIYRMARTALHEKDSQKSASFSPSTQSSTSPSFAARRHLQPRQRQEMEAPAHSFRHYGQQTQGSLQGSPVTTAVEQLYTPSNQNREDSSLLFNTPGSLSGPGIGSAWDPSDLAFMDMLDGGLIPWTADYLTDGQSGVDPLLFPF